MSHSAGPIRPIFISVGQQQAMALRALRYHRRRTRAAVAVITVAIVLVTAAVFGIQAL